MGYSMPGPGDHADGVQPEICGLPDGSQRSRNALKKETKLGLRQPLLTQSQSEDRNQTSSPQPTDTPMKSVAGLKPWKSLQRLRERFEVVRRDT